MYSIGMPSIYTPSPTPFTGPEAQGPRWNWNWSTLTGPDAQDFLHRVTSGETRGLEIGQGGRACFLTPQGKLRAYFHLWRYGADEFGLEFDGGDGGRWRDSLFAAIDQYTFAEKMTLTPVTQLECRWIFAETEAEAELLLRKFGGSEKTQGFRTFCTHDDNAEPVRICSEGSLDFGRPWITAWGRPAQLAQWADRMLGESGKFKAVEAETLEAWRIAALRPRMDRELTENTVPLEVGLTEAIAPNKGCYPGQEIIEKIISLGSPAKRLALIELPGGGPAATPRAGEAVFNRGEPPAEVGLLTSVARYGDDWKGLCLVRKNYAKEGLEVQAAGIHGLIKRISSYAE
jgi:folate-binding protein YgfZ